MAIRFKSKSRASMSSRMHRWDRMHQLEHLKKIAIISILIAASLGFLFFNQSKSVLSDNPHGEVNSQTHQLTSEPLFPQSDRDRSYQGPSNSKVGRPLSDEERQAIAQLLGEPLLPTSTPTFEQTPKFILHDTSGELDDATIQTMQQQARGPMGNGIAAYVAREGQISIARPFFASRRPTATVYEKAADIFPETVRNGEMRRVWQATEPSLRQAALQNAVAGLNLDETSLINRATIWLNAPSEKAFEALKARSSVNLDGGKTTGLWTIARICDRLASSPQAVKTLKNSCQKLNPLLRETRKRVASSVHIELIQKRGSECYVTNAQVKAYNAKVPDHLKISANQVVPLQTWDRPAYTPEQYQQVARLYLHAALQAGQFPEITTHYWVDQGKFGKIGDHCDPRGFDLMGLYQEISFALGHPQETLYGIKAQYGLHPEKGDNVWWIESVFSH